MPKPTSSNDINKNIFYLLYFPNRNGLKDETGNSKKKLLDFRYFPGGLRRGSPCFAAQIERFWLGFAKQRFSGFIYLLIFN